MHRRNFLAGSGAAVAGANLIPFLRSSAAWAQGAGDTLVIATSTTINSLDLHRVGTNRPSYQVTVNLYDRLLTFGTKVTADGAVAYDYTKLKARRRRPPTSPGRSRSPTRPITTRTKELLSQTAFKDGFEVPLSFDLGTAEWGEPAALLIQEGLSKIGIKATIDKIPGANWRTRALVEKKLPLHLENFGGWLDTPCYHFFWAYLKARLGMSYLFVSHDLHVVRLLCDRVIVMKGGRIVECGETEAVMTAPSNACTCELLSAAPHAPL